MCSDDIICTLCNSSEFELYCIQLSDQEKEYIQRKNSTIYTDLCIGPEIEDLIQSGIRTLGCCCGHGECKPHCLVDKGDKHKLDAMGYEYTVYDDTDMYYVILKTDIRSKLKELL